MASSDALVIGEHWISEHFFTTDAKGESFAKEVLGLRRAWDEAGAASIRGRVTAARSELEAGLANLLDDDGVPRRRPGDDDEWRAIAARLRDVLGFTDPGRSVETFGDVHFVRTAGDLGPAPLVIIDTAPVAALEDLLEKDRDGLLSPWEPEDGDPIRSVPRLLSALLVQDDAPTFALVLAGRWALVTDKERWPEGRYLAVDLQLVLERNDQKRGGELDRALACLGADSLAPDADGDIWWTGVLESSIKHTVGVSKELREGVRQSIEIIANEVIARRAEQGLLPLTQDDAQVLATQTLRYLYRILFLLYAEASPELEVLPVGAPEYEQGYSLDRLRDLTLAELATSQAQQGTHLYESLAVLFRLVDTGHKAVASDGETRHEGLTFNALRADLFRPEAISLIDEARLGNDALQRVLQKLLLSKESSRADRGFISYAELGINQLGAVYEGLMSYTGFFAEEDLYEVAKGGDPEKGSWVVPVSRSEGIAEKDFVTEVDEVTGERRAVRHANGTFVFRLSGRARQQSASYYTPEVLTRFTVSQALDELLTPEHTAADVLAMTVCEPALGSGAFAIEAVRQLAEEYLRRRQAELGQQIDPERYAQELQRTKAYIALHNVYGVDLNSTAVELAEITLWLDTMVAGLQAPWFGLHLRRGNSLIGARRATYARSDVAHKAWLKKAAREDALAALSTEEQPLAGRIHHFLLPAAGWGAAADAKEARELAPEAREALHKWRRSIAAKPSKKQLDRLVGLAHRVEILWRLALRRREIAEQAIRRAIPVWGREGDQAGPAVSREEIETALADVNGSYQRLRRVMDAWCAMWFWPLTEETRTVDTGEESLVVKPPTLDQWIEGLTELLGVHHEGGRGARQVETFGSAMSWEDLGAAEELELGLAGARDVPGVLERRPWLQVAERIAQQQGFFHWELDFATIFARGGFDLQVGNPPWVRPRSDVDALLAEGDPWWQLANRPSEAERRAKREATLDLPGLRDLVLDGTGEVAVTAAFVGAVTEYPHLAGLQPDLYRCFMVQTWRHQSLQGSIALIHPETHFTDEKAGYLRREVYARLRRHWHFLNELMLFEIDDKRHYGVHVYAASRFPTSFEQATYLYHPDTLDRSRVHDGSGPEPGLKDPEGNWDLRAHASRIITVDEAELKTWHAVLESPDVPLDRTRMLYTVNRSVARVLEKLSKAKRIGSLGLEFSRGWDESIDRKKGYFETRWGKPDSWDDVILQGPHLHVATPFYKSPNETMRHNQDWSSVDLETLPADAIPVTSYKPAGDRYDYDADYTHWGTDDNPIPARDHYRIAWRCMAANTGERTLIAGLIPPGAAHVDGIFSAGGPALSPKRLAVTLGLFASLLSDFAIRAAPKSTIRANSANRLPWIENFPLESEIRLRVMRLNCLTAAHQELWEEAFSPDFERDSWSPDAQVSRTTPLGEVTAVWTPAVPLRLALDRRQALTEIDALVALALGVTADELCSIYRTQFPVLVGYDRNVYLYDANGRLVPTEVRQAWVKKGDELSVEDRTATHPAGTVYTYEPPFRFLDREADMRAAYAFFERRLAEKGEA